MEKEKTTLAVLMTCHNRRDTTLACLETLEGQTGIDGQFNNVTLKYNIKGTHLFYVKITLTRFGGWISLLKEVNNSISAVQEAFTEYLPVVEDDRHFSYFAF